MSITTYKKCPTCDSFWVTAQDQVCLFCGRLKPYKRKKIPKTLLDILDEILGENPSLLIAIPLAAVEAFLIYVIIWLWIPATPKLKLYGVLFFILTFLNSFLLNLSNSFLFKRLMEIQIKSTSLHEHILKIVFGRISKGLKEDRRIIYQRLEELKAREQRILSARELVEKEMAGEPRVKLLDMFEKAETLVHEQRNRYKFQEWMGRLIVWRNKLAPLEADSENLTDEECGHRIDALAEVTAEGEELRTELESQTEAASTNDGQDCIVQLRKSLARCKRLRDGLITQRSILATKGIGPVKAMLPAVGSNLQYLDLFNPHSDIERYSRSFKGLEDEYARLEFDVEAARQLKELEKDRLLPQSTAD